MSSLFITGATGYVGKRLIALLDVTRFQHVRCLARTPGPSIPGIQWISGDLLDPPSYASSLQGCDTVLHLAAVTGKNSPATFFQVNTQGTRTLLEAARKAGVRNMLYVSSVAAAFRDQTGYHYGQSKKQAEEIVAAGGLRYIIVRPTMVFGPRAPVFEGLLKLAGAPAIPVFGNGRAAVQPVYVDDLVQFLLAILEHDFFPNQIHGAGGPSVLSIEELLIRIRSACLHQPSRIVHVPVGLLLPGLRLFEKFLLPLLPLTAGQLMSFVNDGVVEATAMRQWVPQPTGLDDMLRLSTIS